jgi:hypothetical protein
MIGRALCSSVSAALLLVASGCTPPAEVVRPDDLRHSVPDAKALVVVYSRTGNTAKLGKAFAKELGADYLRLQVEGDPAGSWLSAPSWKTLVSTAPEQVDLSRYSLILVGGPIWMWHPNALTNTFLRRHEFGGKDVVLFYTFEGGALSPETEATWRGWVEEKQGRVLEIVGINRKELPAGATLEQEAQRLARDRVPRWTAGRAATAQ